MQHGLSTADRESGRKNREDGLSLFAGRRVRGSQPTIPTDFPVPTAVLRGGCVHIATLRDASRRRLHPNWSGVDSAGLHQESIKLLWPTENRNIVEARSGIIAHPSDSRPDLKGGDPGPTPTLRSLPEPLLSRTWIA